MKVSTERIPDSQIQLEIEIDDDRVEKAKNSAYRRLAAKAKIPGFRPGKAPRAILERHLGEHAILHEAIDQLLPKVYTEALEQETIEPIDRADYELVTEEPLVVKFTVPVQPTVDLGDYTSLRVPREPVTLDEERVQEALEDLRRRYATLEPAARPAQWNDIIRAAVHGTVDGTVLVNEEDAEFQLVEGRTVSLPGFAEAFIGKEKGASFEFEVPVPDDTPNVSMRGRQANYEVTIKELKEERLPELDDGFARQVGEGFDTLDALRSRIRDDLQQALEQQAERAYHEKILDALIGRATIEYPPVIIERETDRLLRERAGPAQPGRSESSEREQLERYLQQAGKSENELREELRPLAETQVCRSLVLSEVTEAEHIQVTDADTEAEIGRMAGSAGSQEEEIRRLFSTESAKESVRRSLLTKKTLERLVEIAAADGAAPEEDQAGETPND